MSGLSAVAGTLVGAETMLMRSSASCFEPQPLHDADRALNDERDGAEMRSAFVIQSDTAPCRRSRPPQCMRSGKRDQSGRMLK